MRSLGIVGYGSFLYDNTKPSSAQRHKLFARYGMRCVISPQYQDNGIEKSLCLHGYGIDNGAYIDHNRGCAFDERSFIRLCERWGSSADWVAIPDVVGNAFATWLLAQKWIPILRDMGLGDRLLFVWQDGCPYEDLHHLIAEGIGVFIGGSTQGKLKAIPYISWMCRRFGVWCHVGRVNTMRRVQMCIDHGVHSFDGSGWSRFPSSFKGLEEIVQQKQQRLFDHPYDDRILQSVDARCRVMGIERSGVNAFWDKIKNTSTDLVGLPRNKNKKDYSFLVWR